MLATDISRLWISDRGRSFKPSVIQESTKLAEELGAINLAEGFPDFPAPEEVKQAAISAIRRDFNQYRHAPSLRKAIAERIHAVHGVPVDPDSEISVCCGQSEALACAILAVVNPGDEVLVFEPAFETYASCVVLAGGVVRHVAMQPPEWTFTLEQLETAIGPRTKAIIVNSPQNPTGKVFTREEYDIVADVCVRHKLLAITDEVYEHVTFEGVRHLSLLSWPTMQGRVLLTSSLSKTFSVTGWRVGWAVGPAPLISAINNIHAKVTDSAPAPFQEAGAAALKLPPSFYAQLQEDYQGRRDRVCAMARQAGLQFKAPPAGGFFLFAEIPDSYPHDDISFVDHLIRRAGVAVVPGQIFFNLPTEGGGEGRGNGDGGDPETHARTHAEILSPPLGGTSNPVVPSRSMSYKKRYIRIAFCKGTSTLEDSACRLNALTNASLTPTFE